MREGGEERGWWWVKASVKCRSTKNWRVCWERRKRRKPGRMLLIRVPCFHPMDMSASKTKTAAGDFALHLSDSDG
eukprot:764084-Hanusia_phi.AAC.3